MTPTNKKINLDLASDAPLNAANSFRTEVVRKNWKTVLDVAMTNRNFPTNNDMGNNFNSRAIDGSFSNGYRNPQNDIFVNEKFNWLFFALIVSLLVILSIVFCSLVFFFLPKFRIT